MASGPDLLGVSLSDLERVFRGWVASRGILEGTKPGAVMVLFGGDEENPVMILTRRSFNLRTHSGQIGLPGGKPEPGDGSMLATAIRETEEELGVGSEQVDVWGELEPVQTSSTGFGLSVHTGRLKDLERLTPSPEEVDEVLTITMSVVLDPASSRDETRIVDGEAISRPCYSYSGEIVWGATARIVAQVIELLRPELLKESRTPESNPAIRA